jgi:hypothetical protein
VNGEPGEPFTLSHESQWEGMKTDIQKIKNRGKCGGGLFEQPNGSRLIFTGSEDNIYLYLGQMLYDEETLESNIDLFVAPDFIKIATPQY